jgi:flagellar assembly protein FliH
VGPTRRDYGYEDGYAAGTAAAAEEALRAERDRDAAVARAVGALERAVEEVRTAAATWRAEVEAALPAFVLDVVTALLDRELAVAADPGRDALARALVPDLDAGPAVARLHPDDLARLGDVEGLGAGHPLTVVADASVGPGGAVVEQGPTRIDARLTTALDRVRAALAGDDGDAP